MWGKLFKIDRIVRPEATQYTYQKYILVKSYKPYMYTFETYKKQIPPEWVIMA